MKKEFEEYFEQINASSTVVERVNDVISIVESLFGIEITGVFLCDQFVDNARQFGSLWLFSGIKALECRDFLQSDNFDCISLKDSIIYLKITKDNYDNLSSPNDKSTITFSFGLNKNGMNCDFSGVGYNCKYAYLIFKTYFEHNFVE